ncbi:hypothetical protein ALT785_580257 [Alteromonas infernus]
MHLSVIVKRYYNYKWMTEVDCGDEYNSSKNTYSKFNCI